MTALLTSLALFKINSVSVFLSSPNVSFKEQSTCPRVLLGQKEPEGVRPKVKSGPTKPEGKVIVLITQH